ncbi:hypothetical protein [Candidatus Protochlamydia phocaeensis]|uniref:hypothetical protein n=1 Tax=Candidatus Protochlamydia phocaeensis TaxID=1414722 RepID=UPI000838F32C|nr:hypothetical protein [Candidatus Protochlamydia phocaeensis]
MENLIILPFGIILGWILYKIGNNHPTITYLVGILPYFVFFWFSSYNRELWGPYRIAILLGTILAIIIWKSLEAINKKKNVSI